MYAPRRSYARPWRCRGLRYQSRSGLRCGPVLLRCSTAAVGDFVADIPLEKSHPSRAALDRVAFGLADLATVPTLLLWGSRDPVFTEASLATYGSGCRTQMSIDTGAPRIWPWRTRRSWPRTPGRGCERCLHWPHHPARDWPTAQATGDPAIGIAAGVGGFDPAIAELRRGAIRVTSFAGLENRVESLADGLRRVGVRPGHRVALLVPPGLDLTTAVYACWRAGAAIVIADAGLGWRRMADALRSADPDYLIGIPAAVAAAAALRLPGNRLIAGKVPQPIRRVLGIEQSIDELSAPRDRHSVPFDTQRARVHHGCAGERCGGAVHLRCHRAAQGVVYRHHQLRAQLEMVRALCGVTPSDRLVAAFAPFALYGPALGIGAAVPDMDVTKPAPLPPPGWPRRPRRSKPPWFLPLLRPCGTLSPPLAS